MKKKKNKKNIIIILTVLIIICLSCGTIGLLESKKDDSKPDNPKENKEYQVSYRYYIDGTEVMEMPELENIDNENPDFEGAINTVPKYIFERSTCTNDVTGEFDEEKWEFVPNLTANTTCRLYFLNTMHEVTIKASNGKLPNNTAEDKINVELEKNGTINIIPNEGYKFDTVNCSNEVTAEYDSNTKDLKISNVKKEATCNISFKISDYTAEVTAQNGNVTESKKTANYGSNLVFEVTPSENYKFNKATCTNNQNYHYSESEGRLIINGLTNDTICTVEFKPVKFKVTVEVKNGTIASTSENPQEISEGRSASFTIRPNEGYVLTDATISCNNPAGTTPVLQNNIFQVHNVTKDVKCTITLKEKAAD